ncbi:unnamed protein product [Chironomus riparius]|uniref:Peptidase S1 domain-containing protein n=1 Tax=Chironomus riparius TaxID=315576 RepID=A0A9N9S4N4_9DIPT|nr:unnamed protein product [Chironomus riparius]
MNSKPASFWILLIIFWIISTTNAQVASCSYRIEWFEVSVNTFKNSSYYSCNLNAQQSNENIKISRIIGQHYPGYNDNHVTFLNINNNNKFKLFSPFFCQKFPNLQIIKTTAVNFLTIDQDSLINCANLQVFSTFGNRLHAINEYLLYRNPKLTYLSLESNQLNVLPENLLTNQKELLELQLHYNELALIPSNTFKSLVNLQILTLDNNRLNLIDPEWFVNLQKLKILTLETNRITKIQANSFINLINLELLSFGSKPGIELHQNSFNGLQKLKGLSFFDNYLSDLPASIFVSLTNLESMGIQKHQLKTIHSDSFGYHRNLTSIALDDNLINSIDERILDKTAVNTFYMKNNICSNVDSLNRDQIRQNLRQCFNNYQPRALNAASNVPNTPRPIESKQQATIFPFAATLSPPKTNYCGQRVTGHGNIIGGSQLARGDHPWLAALVMRNGKYFCAGNLVTTRKVITAAHCIQDKHTSLPTQPQNIIILLGVFDLDRTVETGRISHAVQSANIHPDWNTLTESFDADIAVLVMETEAVYSRYIQPVCLLGPLSSIIATASGVVVGYGKSEDETKIHENIPKILNSQIHNNPFCFQDNRALARISSGRTFCGGPGRGIGVCRGDSGSGLYVTDGSAYYLRGIVSSSLIGGQYGCDVDTYSVFTDALKFMDWINEI